MKTVKIGNSYFNIQNVISLKQYTNKDSKHFVIITTNVVTKEERFIATFEEFKTQEEATKAILDVTNH